MQRELNELAREAKNLETAGLSATVGFDGFVDEIVEVVNKRKSFDSYSRMVLMSEFAEKIFEAAGLSTNIEIVPKTVKLGGNGPIMANALVRAGVGVSYLGSLGHPNIHPVFLDLAKQCTAVFSLGEPGHTDALEFNDGKIMLGKMESLVDLNWTNMLRAVGEEQLKKLFLGVDLVATVNWTMLPHMNEIWQGLQDLLPGRGQFRPFLFVDLADPGKRSKDHILEALKIIGKFNSGYRVILGLNRKEASEIAAVLSLKLSAAADKVELEEIVTALSSALDFWSVVVHPPNKAGAVAQGRYEEIRGPFTSRPRLTTGAGDNFNAGFCLGIMLELGLKKSLILGKALSGFYVREMRSPSWKELGDFLRLWARRVGQDF
ncbi:MAG: hypothetical protein GX335_00970 [Firmicutes bacterium]|nr:hypothetical protein [Bacillota bacterium]